MIVVLLLAAVAAGAYWAGAQSRTRGAERQPTPEARRRMTTALWPWVLGMVMIAVLVLGFATGPPGMFDGPGLFGGPGGLLTPLER